ncbi:protein phosphatase 1 regulatory subunit 3B [Anthonomus grandis grandis]|uniref:protein phosphatase 1 regulatory subunit 3B n=1 Tax=Anthonomus grandis grandis TaxID=2921223 RepID=UPI002165C2E2|nr:protein phosphatase 1 regulatory subunit 3B [Anthonomus grandis grandis]XP_050305679.1 protein phosphatase 1 regulatory subunit 3B [Anthonomus grandis grandis]XP_050305681.1 protein phosphatase 1 regulatory subunit 3B [Anthonomus grandis grandis]XP_050305682.1 protein phosphatase 1 regulatory subunit 3B [Anthonomus grandis grandis]XP_050305683.1 protein phosphatase 1 regulatory subunit 3B [Anthonomus grandis grandis]
MCSMIDFEMFLPHSPPVFSHSPPTSFLSDFAALHLSPQLQRAASCRQMQQNYNTNYAAIQRPFKSPKRPCLVIRPNDECCSSGDEDPTSPTKLKKKVVFADDRGMSLTHVRVMTEPSGVPPLWSTKFLAEVTQGITAEAEVQQEPWEITFPQPASDYVNFRQKLSDQKVCLENVIIKESEDQVIGTVKVQNLSFHKEVVVRSSFDNWKTHEDTYCTYVPSNITAGSTYIVFDTFSFKINLTPKAKRLEFCVCFRCDGQEYWDSNGGKNYVIVKKAIAPLHRAFSDNSLYCKKNNDKVKNAEMGNKYQDASRAKLDTWSQFASWNHLENSAPYW